MKSQMILLLNSSGNVNLLFIFVIILMQNYLWVLVTSKYPIYFEEYVNKMYLKCYLKCLKYL